MVKYNSSGVIKPPAVIRAQQAQKKQASAVIKPKNQTPSVGTDKRVTAEPLLLNFSGGLDSVYAAYKLLKVGHKLILHHCKLRTRENRTRNELVAVKSVMAWFKEQRLTNFTYLESGYEYGTISPIIYDIEIIGFQTGVILRGKNRQNVKTVVVPSNANDVSITNPSHFRVRHRQQLAELVARRKLQWYFPIKHLTKAQIIADMPKELFLRSWYCRRPDPNGRECHKCKTCLEVDRAIGPTPIIRPRRRTPRGMR